MHLFKFECEASIYVVRVPSDGMSIIVRRQKSVRFNLTGKNCEARFIKELLMATLVEQYQGTCMDRSYVRKIIRIIDEPGPRVWSPRHMYGEMSVVVRFEYDAEIIMDEADVKTGLPLLHGGKVIEIIESDGTILATCTVGDHITVSMLVDLPGIITNGMTVPIRAIKATYEQNIMNNISVTGMLVKPSYYGSRFLHVSEPTEAELDTVREKIAELDMFIAQVTRHSRAQFFKAWLYPYKQPAGKSVITLPSLIAKKAPKAMYVEISDACDMSGLQFILIGKMRPIDSQSFLGFSEMLIDDARRQWGDIEQLSKTYESDKMFNAHQSIWDYYEGAKKDRREEPVPSETKKKTRPKGKSKAKGEDTTAETAAPEPTETKHDEPTEAKA